MGLDPSEEGCFSISGQSNLASLIRMARILIIDEATLLDRRNFEKLERSLRDICNQDKPWGGKIVVLSGDFRWLHCTILHYTTIHCTELHCFVLHVFIAGSVFR